MLVGDGVNASENASKRVLNHFLNQHPTGSVGYRLLVWRCAARQANLVVVVAIAGKLGGSVLDNSPLCATLSRLYRFLVPSYLDEFTAQLRNLVASTFEMRDDVDSDDRRLHQERSRTYVCAVWAASLDRRTSSAPQQGFAKMEHAAAPGIDLAVVKRRMFDCLLRPVWLEDEQPVVTRCFVHSLLFRALPHEIVGFADLPLHSGSPGNRVGLV